MFNIFGENNQNNPTGFDSMLEILPEELDVNWVGAFTSTGSSEQSRSRSQQALLGDEETLQHEDLAPMQPPVDVMNQQNGEIAQLWSFNVDEFMMTPTDTSDSATISAPNSYNSENWTPLNGSSNFAQLLSSPFHQDVKNSDHMGSSFSRAGDEGAGIPFRPTIPSRRSSSQIPKNLADDGGIPLSSSSTANSVRKSSVTRPMSSSSLSSYRQGSTQEVPKKPQVQCFNCETFKTPLWRRDAQGNTLCNACGLFQKLHGTMRPLSLKSDIIRKRNTKKRAKKSTAAAVADTKDKKPLKSASPAKRPEPININIDPSFQTSYSASAPRTEPTSTKGREETSVSTALTTTYATTSSSQVPASAVFSVGDPNTETPSNQLDSSNLLNHNKRIMASAGPGSARKSRRSSTSSSASNSSNRSSSSRSVVPILPKPSSNSSTPQAQFQFLNSHPSSGGESAASSPRFSNSPRASFGASSPLPQSAGQTLSSSGSRPGMVIPRRKSSRKMMSSSSFMAASLQQHHQQQQPQQQAAPQTLALASSSNSTISAPGSWQSGSNSVPSPKTGRSPRSPFDLFSPSEVQSRPASRKSQTSLLSQQLQQATISSQFQSLGSQTQMAPNNANGSGPTSGLATPQPISLKRSSATASPRHSYVDSIQQQRGVYADSNGRRSSSLRADTVPPPPPSNGQKPKEVVMEDLEWLKFGL
ncbi:LAMI_0D02410g1_1 [Lachancea mirantina]|uniref:LAMI_0D02410g1_1 n=1 Tax=Lachancea mirantina TaxID=1230905 RepID=A0A1G4J960_9SACH|nr:LAMI_0D02410g1_1 [Lachancea mirantina]